MIVFGDEVVRWVGAEFDHVFTEGSLGLGLVRGGSIVSGVVFHDRKYHEVGASIVAKPGSITRQFLRAIHEYPYVQLGVRRITACVRASNNKSIEFLARIGFVYEGRQRCGYPDGEDKLLFGQLKEECPWLPSP